MQKKIKSVLFCLTFICCQISFSQIKKEKDSALMYKKIEKYSTKTQFGRFIHQLIFESTNKTNNNPIKIVKVRFENTSNKIIRKINITTLDPIGFSENDTLKTPSFWSERFANRMHIKSSKANIRNILLFKENQVFDSLLIKESERLMRTQNYISSVLISISRPKNQTDSIDINVRVLDSWSFVPTIAVSKTNLEYSFSEKNFIGTGHTLEFERATQNGISIGANRFLYVIPNIKNSFIRTSFLIRNDFLNNNSKNINIERPFYSPVTKWAGGFFIGNEFRRDSLENSQLIKKIQIQNSIIQDIWVGRSFKIFNEQFKNFKATNLIVAARVFNQNYIESPELLFDPIRFFSNETLILTGIGISKRLFVEDKFIFRNGIIEDVPLGLIYGITTGYQFKNDKTQFYFGSQIAYGDYFKFGYLSTNFEFGSYYKNQTSSQSSFVFQLNYFTNLFQIGKWKIRQFLKPQMIIGNNRLESSGDQLNINDNFGIQGFNSNILGTKKMILTFQTQAYSPWVIGGFRLNPFFNYSAAMIGNGEKSFSKSRLFSKIGLGLNINNDYLVFSSFQISISFFPNIPGIGDNIFRSNGFQNSDFGFQSFELAKPRQVIYR